MAHKGAVHHPGQDELRGGAPLVFGDLGEHVYHVVEVAPVCHPYGGPPAVGLACTLDLGLIAAELAGKSSPTRGLQIWLAMP